MSGHSKWATTKHKKAVVDAKRGKMFAKLIKNIEVAARTGGGDPAANPTLFDAIQKAKKTSVPNDNIDRALKRGSGAEAGGADYQAITYEGYAPGDRPGFTFPATFIRGPWVEKVGSGVEVVARVVDGPGSVGRIVAVRQARLLATSFHPEIAGDARIHEVFVDMVRSG